MKKIIFSAMLLFLPFTAFSAIHVVIGSKLNLRQSPSLTSKVLTVIPYGEKIEVLKRTSIQVQVPVEGVLTYWIKIRYKNFTGYVADYFIKTLQDSETLPPLYLQIKLKNNRFIQLENKPVNGESYRVHKLHQYNQRIGYYIINVYYYEGSSVLMINDTTGEQFPVISLPIISPDNKKFFCSSMDIIARYNPSGIRVYELQGNKIKMVYDNTDTAATPMHEVWGSENATWLDNHTIRFNRVTMNNGKKIRTPFVLIYRTNKWIEQKQ